MPKFSIKLKWLLLLVGLACVPLAYYGREYRAVKRKASGLKQIGIAALGVVNCRRSFEPRSWIASDPLVGIPDWVNLSIGDGTPKSPWILRALLGDEAGSRVVELDLRNAQLQTSRAIGVTAISFPNLEVLLAPTDVSDYDLRLLGPLRHLQVLSLEACRALDGTGVAYLANLKSLSALNLRLTSFQQAEYQALTRLEGLRVLLLAHSSFRGESLEHLLHLEELRWLELPSKAILDGRHSLTGFRHLQKIAATCTDEGLLQLAQIESLAELDISGSKWLTKTSLDSLTNMNLRVLVLRDCYLDNDDIVFLHLMPRLEHLDLSMNRGISDKAVSVISDASSVSRLILAHTTVTDESIDSLLRLGNLQTVDLSGTRITQEGINRLVSARPQLQVICGR